MNVYSQKPKTSFITLIRTIDVYTEVDNKWNDYK